MKTITLPSGIYAVDPILDGFDIIERPSSNVAFVGTDMLADKMYVQFKRGSGYMYSGVDIDTLSFVHNCESIGKFISSQVVNHFPSEKQEKALIEFIPPLIITGTITGFPDKCELGKVFVMSEGSTIEYIEPEQSDIN
jgi:hypothetical protein